MSEEPDPYGFPRNGVSLNFLIKYWSARFPPNTKVSEIYKTVLDQTKMKSGGTSMVEYWDFQSQNTGTIQNDTVDAQTQTNENDPHSPIKPAEYYIVHVWEYRLYEDLLQSLENYRISQELDDLVVWIDIFSLNLHTLQRQLRKYQWWGQGFVDDLKNFKECVVVYADWSKSLPTNRTWCCWEIYNAAVAEVPLAIALSKTEIANLENNIVSKFGDLVVALKDFDVTETQAYDRRMKKRTFAAISKLDGAFTMFNAQGIHGVREWWTLKAISVLPVLRSIYARKTTVKDIRAFMKFYNELGFMLRSLGMVEETAAICREALEYSKTKRSYFINYPKEQARDLNNLGVALSEVGAVQEAIACGEECIHTLKDVIYQNRGLLLKNEDIWIEKSYLATALNNLGNLLCENNMHDIAVEKYEESVRLKIELNGPDHPLVAAGLNNLGVAYMQTGAYGPAEKVYRQALAIRSKMLGVESIEAAQSAHNLGEVLSIAGFQKEAKVEALKALNIAVKQLGEEHPVTEAYSKLVAEIEEELNKPH